MVCNNYTRSEIAAVYPCVYPQQSVRPSASPQSSRAASDAASEATEASARAGRKAGFTGIQGVLDKLRKFIGDERVRVDREHKHDVDTARKQMEKEHAAQDLRLLREQQRLQGIVDRKTAVSLA